MEEYINLFRALLVAATDKIHRTYFHLPIDGSNLPIYRERVYCYELYHQLRTIWPDDYPFSLGGEVDKSGHPLFRDHPKLRDAKPDLLVHQPGNMDGNLVVLEVKPVNASHDKILKFG